MRPLLVILLERESRKKGLLMKVVIIGGVAGGAPGRGCVRLWRSQNFGQPFCPKRAKGILPPLCSRHFIAKLLPHFFQRAVQASFYGVKVGAGCLRDLLQLQILEIAQDHEGF